MRRVVWRVECYVVLRMMICVLASAGWGGWVWVGGCVGVCGWEGQLLRKFDASLRIQTGKRALVKLYIDEHF